MLLEVEAGAPRGRGRGSNDCLALAGEAASWDFTLSSRHPTLPVALCTTCQPLGCQTRARLEVKVSWKNNGVAVDRRPWLSFAQQPESLRAWLELGLQLEPFWQNAAARIKQFCLQLQDFALVCREGRDGRCRAGL